MGSLEGGREVKRIKMLKRTCFPGATLETIEEEGQGGGYKNRRKRVRKPAAREKGRSPAGKKNQALFPTAAG